jgi:hypothetical protein
LYKTTTSSSLINPAEIATISVDCNNVLELLESGVHKKNIMIDGPKPKHILNEFRNKLKFNLLVKYKLH